jgi:hypothetical protein
LALAAFDVCSTTTIRMATAVAQGVGTYYREDRSGGCSLVLDLTTCDSKLSWPNRDSWIKGSVGQTCTKKRRTSQILQAETKAAVEEQNHLLISSSNYTLQ